MSNFNEIARTEAENLILKAYAKASENSELLGGAELNGKIEISKDAQNGDFASNHALSNAKALRSNPRKIAESLLKYMDFENSLFLRAEIAGPGFINFFLSDSWYAQVLKEIRAAGNSYGSSDALKGESILLEFVSANPTGPMHIGNARGGVLGDSLAAILNMAGAKCQKEFYVNNYGNQILNFAASIEARYMNIAHGEDIYEIPADGYHGEDITDIARACYDKHGEKLCKLSSDERREKLAAFGLEVNIAKMQNDLARYGVNFDRWFFESELYEADKVNEAVRRLSDLGYTYEKDDAVWLKSSEIVAERLRAEGKSEKQIEALDLKDDVLKRGNGLYTYFAADIAYHINKLETRGIEKAINVWGADHHGHVARLKGALDALGLCGEERLQIVLMQLVKLFRNGELYRMSKRTGKSISLSDLLDEVPLDAARWFFNSKPDSPMDFDLDLAIREDSENPVYYVQYAHARICSLVENLKESGYEIKKDTVIDASLLKDESERALIKQLALLPDEVVAAALFYDPSKINKYLIELSARFHRFYNSCRIREAEENLLLARLCLVKCTAIVLKNGLNILGISAPEKM